MQPASSLDLSSHFLNTAELGELPLGFGASLTLSHLSHLTPSAVKIMVTVVVRVPNP